MCSETNAPGVKKILFILFMLLLPLGVGAQTCPFGLENDPAPGSCSSFIDENENALCDLSEVPLDVQKETEKVEYISGEELKQYTVSQVAAMYKVSASAYAEKLSDYTKQIVKVNDSLQFLHDEYGLCSGVAGSIALDLKNTSVSQANITNEEQAQEHSGKEIFDIVPITLILLAFYFLTYFLAKSNKISMLTHRRIWNVLLLVTFLISGILGLLLAIRINYGWSVQVPFNMTEIHVEAGIAMMIISFFHIAWHWRYYACMLKKTNKCDKNE